MKFVFVAMFAAVVLVVGPVGAAHADDADACGTLVGGPACW